MGVLRADLRLISYLHKLLFALWGLSLDYLVYCGSILTDCILRLDMDILEYVKVFYQPLISDLLLACIYSMVQTFNHCLYHILNQDQQLCLVTQRNLSLSYTYSCLT